MLKIFKRPPKSATTHVTPPPQATAGHLHAAHLHGHGTTATKQKSSRLKQSLHLLTASLPYYLPLGIYFFDYWLKKYFAAPSLHDITNYFLTTGIANGLHVAPAVYGWFVLWVLAIPFAIACGIALFVMLLRLILIAVGQIAFDMIVPSFLTNQQAYLHSVVKKILPKKIVDPAEPIVVRILEKIVDKLIFFVKWLVVIIFIAINGVVLVRDMQWHGFWQSQEKDQLVEQVKTGATTGGWNLLHRLLPFLPAREPLTPATPAMPDDNPSPPDNNNPDNNTAPNTTTPTPPATAPQPAPATTPQPTLQPTPQPAVTPAPKPATNPTGNRP